MSNNRYVHQGEYYITQDSNTVLATEGMTECIAFAIVDKANPKNRLLSHFDGMILESKAAAKQNIQELVDKFKSETGSKEFEVHCLGGQKKLENFENLSHAFAELKIVPTQFVTSKEFCNQQNENKKFSMNPTNAQITLISFPDGTIKFVSYSSKHFITPIALHKLEIGEGLISSEEKKQYQAFIKANSNILENYPDASKKLRHCGDQKLIEKYLKKNKENKIDDKNIPGVKYTPDGNS